MNAATNSIAHELLARGIVSAVEMQKALDGGGAESDESLFANLISLGLLTPFQTTAVRARKFSELAFGNYIVLDKLGEGGMGTVYKAKHLRMKRVVAIKVLLLDKANDRGRIELFQREIETMAQLGHPNIVAAYDADECEHGAYLVMEFVGGSDLSTQVKTHGLLMLRRAVDYITQAARGLHYAHAQHVVHGDIKPANMLLSQDGTVKITDLGLARMLKGASPLALDKYEAANQASISGTVSFMPPEQAFQPDAVDHRADIYSLGCSLYYLLTGRLLFDEEKTLAMLLAHRDRLRPLLRDARPDAPPELEAVFQRMVAAVPADRFSSMDEVVEALEACELPDEIDSTFHSTAPDNVNHDSTTDVGPTVCISHGSLALAGISVLLVEQSRLQTRVISAQMAELGIPVIRTAASGQEAWEAMLSQCPDVVVSSMHLPDMTGAELVRRMRHHDSVRDAAFVLISSETDYEFLEPVRQSGTAAILPKPFELPSLMQALKAAVDFSPHAVKAHNLRLTKLRVLIADDSRSARRHARRVLESLGGENFIEAVDGSEAIRFLADNQFDLIVTDWHMPECDGLELTRHIRHDPRHQHVPVLMITSETDPSLLDTAIRTGVSAICPKVFDPQSVAEILNSLLDAGRKANDSVK